MLRGGAKPGLPRTSPDFFKPSSEAAFPEALDRREREDLETPSFVFMACFSVVAFAALCPLAV